MTTSVSLPLPLRSYHPHAGRRTYASAEEAAAASDCLRYTFAELREKGSGPKQHMNVGLSSEQRAVLDVLPWETLVAFLKEPHASPHELLPALTQDGVPAECAVLHDRLTAARAEAEAAAAGPKAEAEAAAPASQPSGSRGASAAGSRKRAQPADGGEAAEPGSVPRPSKRQALPAAPEAGELATAGAQRPAVPVAGAPVGAAATPNAGTRLTRSRAVAEGRAAADDTPTARPRSLRRGKGAASEGLGQVLCSEPALAAEEGGGAGLEAGPSEMAAVGDSWQAAAAGAAEPAEPAQPSVQPGACSGEVREDAAAGEADLPASGRVAQQRKARPRDSKRAARLSGLSVGEAVHSSAPVIERGGEPAHADGDAPAGAAAVDAARPDAAVMDAAAADVALAFSYGPAERAKQRRSQRAASGKGGAGPLQPPASPLLRPQLPSVSEEEGGPGEAVEPARASYQPQQVAEDGPAAAQQGGAASDGVAAQTGQGLQLPSALLATEPQKGGDVKYVVSRGGHYSARAGRPGTKHET